MEGQDCPRCRRSSEWIATLNEWQFRCIHCRIRFNSKGDVYNGVYWVGKAAQK